MKPNTLNIIWKKVRKSSVNGGVNIHPSEEKESFKCSSKEGAKRIIGKRRKENIKKAVFTSNVGFEFKIV